MDQLTSQAIALTDREILVESRSSENGRRLYLLAHRAQRPTIGLVTYIRPRRFIDVWDLPLAGEPNNLALDELTIGAAIARHRAQMSATAAGIVCRWLRMNTDDPKLGFAHVYLHVP